MTDSSNPSLAATNLAAGAPAKTEIEITPAMIEAGLEHLYHYHPETGVSDEETVVNIFMAMTALSLHAHGAP
jgi:hypothetical protein